MAIGRDIIFLHLIVISLIQCYYYLYTYLKQNETEDTSLENTRNQDGIGAWELLAASFGTSYQDTRCRTIGAIEEELERAFPEYSVRRGFTSRMIINRVKTRDQIAIDSLEEALKRAADNKVRHLIVQPTHMMDGFEYTALVNKVEEYSHQFERTAVGKPLLSSEEDFQAVVQALIEETEEYDDGETAFCFMGHGTEAQANHVYRKLQEMFLAAGHENYFIGTVEAEPALEEVLAQVKKGSYKRAVLQPLMIVAGDHANNDMAGDEEGSWKRAFEEAGYEVSCILRGLGELEKIRRIFIKHAKEAESCLLAV